MGLAELTSTKYVIYGNGQAFLERKTLDLKIKGFLSPLMCILHMRLFTVPQSILDIFESSLYFLHMLVSLGLDLKLSLLHQSP